ncbi:Cysteine desulfurase [Nocardioides dokdonensis FR1436]|uniref:Cysteine desulfurase n=1 Tax=Nocardioides dokdonensis FR1436 TaxID=1300347 RepID=A0A1A9GIH5_9ACTN|nr:cysteine desulfurase-like protein [Nocardioides dokdonensis]ANH37886.1 Cysteine desulfurase [Nocardioides dokdonensis FR1436]
MAVLDVDRVRAWFPALSSGPDSREARFDGPGGSLVPSRVAEAVAEAMTAGMCQRGALTPTQRRTEATVGDARAAIGDLLGTDPRGVVLGRSMTALTFEMARTLAQDWGPGDEVVVSRLDHDSNIRPWVLAAERAGAVVRWIDFDPVTAELDPVGTVRGLLSERTRLVAVTAASNLFGTRPDVAAISAAAHEVGALTYVDAVHLAPHTLVDRVALGADLVACSPYKFFGPHLGAVAGDPALLETLRPDKLLPSSDAVPERFELGTLPYEMLAGVTAAVDALADLLDQPGDLPRRERLAASMAAVGEHEDALLARLLGGVDDLPGVRVHGSPARRTPTVLLGVDGHDPAAVQQHLVDRDVLAPAGSFYALEASRHAGLGDAGGVRVGLSPYSTAAEVDRLLTGLAAL